MTTPANFTNKFNPYPDHPSSKHLPFWDGTGPPLEGVRADKWISYGREKGPVWIKMVFHGRARSSKGVCHRSAVGRQCVGWAVEINYHHLINLMLLYTFILFVTFKPLHCSTPLKKQEKEIAHKV